MCPGGVRSGGCVLVRLTRRGWSPQDTADAIQGVVVVSWSCLGAAQWAEGGFWIIGSLLTLFAAFVIAISRVTVK